MIDAAVVNMPYTGSRNVRSLPIFRRRICPLRGRTAIQWYDASSLVRLARQAEQGDSTMALLRTVPRVLAVLVVIVQAGSARADILKVPGEYATIQQAIDAAEDGDVIVVARGTYSERGNVDLNSLGRDLTIRSENGPDSCILDAKRRGRHFVFENGETDDFLVDGFTLRNGSAREADSAVGDGGSVLCDNGSSPVFRNCRFVHNTAYAGGAVIARSSSHPRFESCKFDHNRATWGGAIGAVNFSGPGLYRCSFQNNSAQIGGAIVGWFGWYYSDDSGPDIEKCEFAANQALDTATMASAGGAMYLFRSYPYVSRCVFRGNDAEGAGGAIHGHKSNPLLMSCLFVDNEAIWGGAYYNDPFSIPTIVNCTIVNNRAKLAAEGSGRPISGRRSPIASFGTTTPRPAKAIRCGDRATSSTRSSRAAGPTAGKSWMRTRSSSIRRLVISAFRGALPA